MLPYIEDKELADFTKAHYRLPIYAIIRVDYKGAQFIGQTKTSFRDGKFNQLYVDALSKTIDAETGEIFYLNLIEDIEQKYKEFFSKNMTSSGIKNIESLDDAENYYPCDSSTPREQRAIPCRR